MLLCIYSWGITWSPAFKWIIYLTSIEIAEVIFEPLMWQFIDGDKLKSQKYLNQINEWM